ncbi:MAG TPA: hypothetical protein VFM01_18185 [Nakamurella sp.]|jgi:hypothetical protein|nr:hypothetical protein [Nakamurella sp.]
MADEKGTRISVDELTRAAFGGVLSALKEQKMRPELFPGPILVGIIAWPELSQFGGRVAGDLTQRGG